MSIKLGIIRTSSIGDVVLATACLDFIKNVAPQAQVLWVGREPTLSLIAGAWPDVQSLDLPSNANASQKAIVRLGLKSCDVIIDLQNSYASRRLTSDFRKQGKSLIVAKKLKLYRLGLVLKSFLRGRLFQLPSTLSTVRKYQYEMMLDAVKAGLNSPSHATAAKSLESRPKLNLTLSNTAENLLWREMTFGEWIAVAPGASHEPKRAPVAVFRDVLQSLADLLSVRESKMGLVFVGSAEDRKPANDLIDEIAWNAPVLNLAGKLTIEQSAAVLSRARALLCNDSGLAHISEAVGTPVSVLFGPTVEAFGFAPWRLQSRAHSSAMGCRPCSRHGKRSCRFGDHLCFHSIDTRNVARHLAKLAGENK